MRPVHHKVTSWAVDEPETIGDRVVAAVISALAAALTGAALAVFIFLMAGDTGGLPFWTVFFYSSAGFVLVAGIAGALAGPRRAADLWGKIWGTDSLEPGREPVFLLAMIIALAVVALWMEWPW